MEAQNENYSFSFSSDGAHFQDTEIAQHPLSTVYELSIDAHCVLCLEII